MIEFEIGNFKIQMCSAVFERTFKKISDSFRTTDGQWFFALQMTETGDQSRQTKNMVPVKMRDADVGDFAPPDFVGPKPVLRSLSTINQEKLLPNV